MTVRVTLSEAVELLQSAVEHDIIDLKEALQIEQLADVGAAAPLEVVALIDEVATCDCCVLCEKKCKGSKKAPVGSPRQRSFCRRMCGHRKKNTGTKAAKNKDSCINQSLRRWRCRCS